MKQLTKEAHIWVLFTKYKYHLKISSGWPNVFSEGVCGCVCIRGSMSSLASSHSGFSLLSAATTLLQPSQTESSHLKIAPSSRRKERDFWDFSSAGSDAWSCDAVKPRFTLNHNKRWMSAELFHHKLQAFCQLYDVLCILLQIHL